MVATRAAIAGRYNYKCKYSERKFVAPEVSANTIFTFQLRVTDNGGASTNDSANVTITNTPATAMRAEPLGAAVTVLAPNPANVHTI